MAHDSVVTLGAFDYLEAHRLGQEICRLGLERGLPIGVEVFHGTSQVFLALLPGSKPDNIEWLRRKRNVALRFHQSSLAMRLDCEARKIDFGTRFGLPGSDFIATGGAVPVAVAGAGLVGCATVSGLPHTEDDALVREALGALLS